MIATTPIPPGPTRSINNNDPHHFSFSPDRSRVFASGMMSSRMGMDDIFVFSLGTPESPSFETSFRIPGYGCADSFLPSPDGVNMVVTMMCDSAGNTPGALVSIDAISLNFSVCFCI